MCTVVLQNCVLAPKAVLLINIWGWGAAESQGRYICNKVCANTGSSESIQQSPQGPRTLGRKGPNVRRRIKRPERENTFLGRRHC